MFFNTREDEFIETRESVRVTKKAISLFLAPSALAQSESPSCISSIPSSSSSIGAGTAGFSMPGGSGSFGKADGTEEASPSLDRFSSGPSDVGLDLAVTGLSVAAGLFGAVFSLGLSFISSSISSISPSSSESAMTSSDFEAGFETGVEGFEAALAADLVGTIVTSSETLMGALAEPWPLVGRAPAEGGGLLSPFRWPPA